MNPESRIRELFAEYPDVIYGFCDISYSPYGRQYRSAIVLAVPYGKQLTTETYKEQDFEDGIQSAKTRLELILRRLETLLQACGVLYDIPPVAQSDEKELLAPFSFKHAATRAGIGWIGKNDVVVTQRYGPRVRLSAVLIDAPLTFGEPITESKCPEDCVLCVEACPCKALYGVRWDASKQRSELIDYHRCNRMRSSFIPRLGRKHACGRCLAACPFGKQSAMLELCGGVSGRAQAVLLNGPSSSGKSTLAKALQALIESKRSERYEVVSIDDFMKGSPNETIYEDDVYEISGDMCEKALEILGSGSGVIIDHVITSERIFRQLTEMLAAYPLRKVHISCPLDILREREQARGDRCPGSAEASAEYLYPKDGYEMTIDTSRGTQAGNALTIYETLFKS